MTDLDQLKATLDKHHNWYVEHGLGYDDQSIVSDRKESKQATTATQSDSIKTTERTA